MFIDINIKIGWHKKRWDQAEINKGSEVHWEAMVNNKRPKS